MMHRLTVTELIRLFESDKNITRSGHGVHRDVQDPISLACACIHRCITTNSDYAHIATYVRT